MEWFRLSFRDQTRFVSAADAVQLTVMEVAVDLFAVNDWYSLSLSIWLRCIRTKANSDRTVSVSNKSNVR